MESVALLEQRYRYEGSIRQLEDKLASAQEQLKTSVERSAKMRQQFERCGGGGGGGSSRHQHSPRG